MILAEYENKRITFEDLKSKLIENELSDDFLEMVVLNLLPLQLFLKKCLENNHIIKNIILLKSEINNKRIKLGFCFENISTEELVDKYKYLTTDDSFIFFAESFYFSKELFNYDSNKIPYIKPNRSLI